MCIPKLTHIATVIPNLSMGQIIEIEKEFEIFLNDGNPSVTDKMTIYMTKKGGGLGMFKINHFWHAIKMSWLRRSTWAELRKANMRPQTYNPISANWFDIETAKNKMNNQVLKYMIHS